ncbi:MAG: ribonuclease III [Clostridiales bacterium]|nr:ribonuclease III [Clostridiales bacterium]
MKNNFITLFEKCSDELKDLAFTHSSFAHEKKLTSNERIEFLGDTVLSTIVSDYLYKHTHLDEGKMTKLRASFVCTENLSELAKTLGIESRIKFGKSFKNRDISDAILADTVESMIGVMYLSYGMHSISTAVLDALKVKELLKKGIKPQDFKSELQELIQENKQKLEYKIEKYETKGGQENFRANTFIDGEFVSYGQGSTRKEAEQNSAKLALEKLKRK